MSEKSNKKSTPSVTSTSFFNVSDTIRNAVRIRDGTRCWACGYRGNAINCCHVIPEDQLEKFLYYKEHGFLPHTLTHLAHRDNIITLCANCHADFDSAVPALTIIPTNMEYFIGYEENDYERRIIAARAGREPPQRTVPSAQDYINKAGKFKAYTLKSGRPDGKITR
ncbi:MAG: hypothetical protein M1813_006049 [Trichoglossum hirsutum]|nr:MAG: hypothetical protein M1813_006049 [Trichoglossum hirsutum]